MQQSPIVSWDIKYVQRGYFKISSLVRLLGELSLLEQYGCAVDAVTLVYRIVEPLPTEDVAKMSIARVA